jgi:hypothetical protein
LTLKRTIARADNAGWSEVGFRLSFESLRENVMSARQGHQASFEVRLDLLCRRGITQRP